MSSLDNRLPLIKTRSDIHGAVREPARIGSLPGMNDFPAIISARFDGVDLASWAERNRDQIDELLDQRAAVLFRGFSVGSAQYFADCVTAMCGDLLEYTERSSPRTHISGNVYTATDYAAQYPIFQHNEQSYNIVFPRRIAFGCLQPPTLGGETPVTDCRKVFESIDPAVRRRFIHLGYYYVRNFGQGLGLTWRQCFQTDSREAVERYCLENDIEFEWGMEGRLRTKQKRPVAARNPRTGELTWFNHLTFFHVSTLPTEVSDRLRATIAEEDLPNNTFNGDGSPIESSVLQHLRDAYQAHTVKFAWEKGDVLLLDNILAAHGRTPYQGPRRIVTSLAQPCEWASVEVR
jgi:alpha-ketoglutarate-dependent taurine dioxygenase